MHASVIDDPEIVSMLIMQGARERLTSQSRCSTSASTARRWQASHICFSGTSRVQRRTRWWWAGRSFWAACWSAPSSIAPGSYFGSRWRDAHPEPVSPLTDQPARSHSSALGSHRRVWQTPRLLNPNMLLTRWSWTRTEWCLWPTSGALCGPCC